MSYSGSETSVRHLFLVIKECKPAPPKIDNINLYAIIFYICLLQHGATAQRLPVFEGLFTKEAP